MVKQANLTAIMLVQQIEEEYWLSSDYQEPLKLAKDGNCRLLLEKVVERLEAEKIKVAEAYGIIHDKDTITIWNTQNQKNIEEPKATHVHFLLKFEKGVSLPKLALAIGVEPQYLEKLKSGRYGYDNCLAYLVHAKEDGSKYQYPAEEVVTVSGEDYISLYNRKMETWLKGRAKKEAQETNLSVDWLIAEILAGHLSKSQILLTNEYYKVYGQHKRKINEAFDTFGERKGYEAVADLEKGKFKKSIIFLTADSGAGKTALSKKFIGILQTVALKFNFSWDFCVTASSNAFDEYNGQDILFLDDIRGDSLSVSDWLKLLDPYMISPISARYHNKMGSAKVIIITSTKEPYHFFNLAKGNVEEDLGQFNRRIDYLVELGKQITLSVPEKQDKLKYAQNQIPWALPPFVSYDFSQKEVCTINKTLDILVKTVIRNMQWNHKKAISDIDQNTEDSHKTKQK